ncbi:MAG: PmbA protein, partial [Candidatus Paceibacteria bacterium]
MSMLQREEALKVARGIVGRSQADETEVVLESTAERFVRFADSGPTQNADRVRHQVAIRARVRAEDGWQEGKATVDGLGEEGIEAALARALDLARVAPPNPDLGPLEGGFEGMQELGHMALDEATLDHSFAQKAEWVKVALALCSERKLAPAGLVTTAGNSLTVVNSAGREVHDARSRAGLSLTASSMQAGGGSGFAEGLSFQAGALDAEAIFARSVGKAVQNSKPVAIDPGAYTVLLEPSAVSSILLFASYRGFGAQEVHEKSSFLCGRIGKQVFPTFLSISDQVDNGQLPGFAMDYEGSPKRDVELIREGVLQGPVTDSDWARKLSVPNTGHALPKPSPEGPMALNLVVTEGESSVQELIAGIDRGLVVTQFHYSNLIDPKDLLLTGMTRNGTFLVEHGEVVGAVKNLRFTESLVNAFQNLSGLSRERE